MRFSEALSLTMRAGDDGQELLGYLRARVQQAEECLGKLHYALKQAWSENKKSKASYWPKDAAANFWRQTEDAFLEEKRRLCADDPSATHSRWPQQLRDIALTLFDQLTEDAAVDPVRAQRVARARSALRSQLSKLLSLHNTPPKASTHDPDITPRN